MTDTTNNPNHDVNAWPYPRMDKLYKANDSRWLEVSEETYWNQLEAVPPRKFDGIAFLVGEAWDYSSFYECDLHAAYIIIDKRYFGKNQPVTNFYPNEWAREIREQLKV